MSEPLALTEVTIALGDCRLFAPLSFTVAPGEITTVMGPSGSGKSTLLSYLSGFLAAPFKGFGRVAIGEQDIAGLAAERRRIGILKPAGTRDVACQCEDLAIVDIVHLPIDPAAFRGAHPARAAPLMSDL